MDCDVCRRLLPAYGDNELSVESALAVERHLGRCAPCGAALDRQRSFARTVGHLYPRAPLPAGLADRVQRAVGAAPRSRVWLHTLALAASVLLALGTVRLLTSPRAADAPPTVIAAAAVHRGAGHAAALAIRSSDAATVNAWLANALPFPINAPIRQSTAMTLEGASVVRLGGERAGYVQYRHDSHLVSLFVLPPRVWPENDRRVQVQESTFHLYTIDGLKLIAWNHPPLSYVLVSDLGGQGGQACASCHGTMAGDRFMDLPSNGEI